jgi:solute carrier family 29 (equilibrative nucleoside transporter), member 1/2/3
VIIISLFQDEDHAHKQERKGNKELFFENIDYLLDMFLIYALTLSIFPGFLSEDTGAHSLGTWYVHCYLPFKSLVILPFYFNFKFLRIETTRTNA